MKNLIFVFALVLGLAGSAMAQEYNPLKINRFTPTYTKALQVKGYTVNPTLKISQTDTTAVFEFNSRIPNDTLLEAAVGSSADSIRLSYKVQYMTGKYVLATGVLDSVCYATPGTSYNVQGRGKALWFTRPVGATGVRLIIATAATGNEGGYKGTPTDTYWAAIATRIKK